MYESSQETRVTKDSSQALFLTNSPWANRVQGLYHFFDRLGDTRKVETSQENPNPQPHPRWPDQADLAIAAYVRSLT